jgi:hypothetical protein
MMRASNTMRHLCQSAALIWGQDSTWAKDMAGIGTEILINLMRWKLPLYKFTANMAWNIGSNKTRCMKLVNDTSMLKCW